MAPVITDPA